jgi:serine/threonine protein kinase
VYGDYNAWLFRSPEEYEYSLQTEKIDVYSMGNIFYSLLMNEDPFEKEYDRGGSSRVQSIVKRGDRPILGRATTKSSDPIEKALIKAMSMCHVHDWRERANSKEVSDFLSLEWAKCLEQKRCEPGPDDEGFEVAKK